MKKIRSAVIGLGVGYYHAQIYKKNKFSNLIQVCDFNKRIFDKIKRKFPKVNFTKDVKKIYKNNKIDLVSVASYDNFHYDQVSKLIKKGKNIFAEKPLCLNFNQLKKIFNLLKQKKIKLNCNFVLRALPEFIELKKNIESGKLGKIYYIEGDYNYGRLKKLINGWRGKIKNYSVTLGGTVHMIDLILWLTNKKFSKVISEGNNISSKKSNFIKNDLVTSLIKMQDNSLIKLTANFGSVTPHHHLLKVYGTKGSFCKTLNQTYYTFSRDHNKKIHYIKNNKKVYHNSKQKILNQFIKELYYKKNLKMTHKQIYEAMKVAFLIDKSLKSKKWERKC